MVFFKKLVTKVTKIPVVLLCTHQIFLRTVEAHGKSKLDDVRDIRKIDVAVTCYHFKVITDPYSVIIEVNAQMGNGGVFYSVTEQLQPVDPMPKTQHDGLSAKIHPKACMRKIIVRQVSLQLEDKVWREKILRGIPAHSLVAPGRLPVKTKV